MPSFLNYNKKSKPTVRVSGAAGDGRRAARRPSLSCPPGLSVSPPTRPGARGLPVSERPRARPGGETTRPSGPWKSPAPGEAPAVIAAGVPLAREESTTRRGERRAGRVGGGAGARNVKRLRETPARAEPQGPGRREEPAGGSRGRAAAGPQVGDARREAASARARGPFSPPPPSPRRAGDAGAARLRGARGLRRRTGVRHGGAGTKHSCGQKSGCPRAWASFPFAVNPPGGAGRGPQASGARGARSPAPRSVSPFTLGANRWTGEASKFGLICSPRGIARSLSVPDKLQNRARAELCIARTQ